MKKIIRLTESDLRKIVRKVMIEQDRLEDNDIEDGIHYFKTIIDELIFMGAIDSRNPKEVPIILNLLDLGLIIEKSSKEEFDEHVKNGGAFLNLPDGF